MSAKPNPQGNAIIPFAEDAPDSIRQELLNRFDELSNLEKEQVAVGTTVPALYSSLAKYVANPSTVSVETYARMIDTDETIGSGVDFMNLALISRWGEYKHPVPEIEKFVRRAIGQMEGSWHTNLDEMFSAEWAGFSCTEMIWKYIPDFDGAPAFVPKRLVTYQPLTMVFAVDQAGDVLEDGIYQYQRYHNSFFNGAFRGQNRQGDLDGFRPDLFAATGDFPYPVRIASDVSFLTVKIPKSKVLHLTSSSTGKFRNPYGRSILRRAYKNWVMKDAFLKMWLVAADRKGTPLVVAYAPPNDTIQSQVMGIGQDQAVDVMRADQAMANVLANVHNSSFIVIPGKKTDGFEIEAIQIQGDMNVFQQGVDYFNKAIMRALLIPPLVMSGGDGAGSYALGESHKKVFENVIDGKGKVYKEAVLEHFVKKIIAYNFPRKLWEKEGLGEFVVEDYDPEVMSKLADVFDRLSTAGYMDASDQADLDHVRSKFGLPKKQATSNEPDPFDDVDHADTHDLDGQITDLEAQAADAAKSVNDEDQDPPDFKV